MLNWIDQMSHFLCRWFGILCPPEPTPPPTPDPPPEEGDPYAIVLQDHNLARGGSRRPLKHDADLQQAAQDHANWMARNGRLSHTGEGGSSPSDRAGEPVGENIAWNYDAKDVTQGWMDSPGHRANILNDMYSRLGVGINNRYICAVYGYHASNNVSKQVMSTDCDKPIIKPGYQQYIGEQEWK